MDTAEAIELALTLPVGSRFKGSNHDADKWTETQYMLAEIIDRLDMLACRYYYEREPIRFERPFDHLVRKETQKKQKAIQQKIEETAWEEVEYG